MLVQALKYPLATNKNIGGFMLYILDTNQQTTRKLTQDLKSFGLNPHEWNLLREKSQEYRIESKQDQNFVFKGKASRKGKWDQLVLISI